MRLTEHFSLDEFTHSETAAALGLDNTPTSPVVLDNLRELAMLLEDIRERLGGHAVVISSGYRGELLNRAVGGVPTSDHCSGRAADIKIPGFGAPLFVAQALEPHYHATGMGQLIYECVGSARWVHISTRAPDRALNQVLTYDQPPGKKGVYHLGIKAIP